MAFENSPLLEILAAHPVASYLIFGALGGLLYILRMKMKEQIVTPVEYLSRPLFGAISAFLITVSLGLPNSGTSLFVGYFGIDVWDALAKRMESRLGEKLPLSARHADRRYAPLVPTPPTETQVERAEDVLDLADEADAAHIEDDESPPERGG